MFLLRDVLSSVIGPITYVVNLSFSTGAFPSKLKIGRVVPVHKKLDRAGLNNYRSITVTSVFSKILEYCSGPGCEFH